MSELRPLTREQAELVKSFAHIVEPVARNAGREYRTVPLDELCSIGQQGLLDAASEFDPAFGVPFPAFACTKIRWAILTGMRKERRQWSVWKAAAMGGANAFAEMTEPDERLAFAEDSDAERAFDDLRSGFVMAMVAGLSGRARAQAEAGEQEVLAEESAKKTKALIDGLLADLPPRDQDLVRQHYFEGRTLKEIASDRGPSYATLRRRHHALILRLAARLRGRKPS